MKFLGCQEKINCALKPYTDNEIPLNMSSYQENPVKNLSFK